MDRDTMATNGRSPYWGKLLFYGLVLLVVAAVLYNAWFNSGSGEFGTQRTTALLDGALLAGGFGQLFLVPGLIGWGLDAAGLAARKPLDLQP